LIFAWRLSLWEAQQWPLEMSSLESLRTVNVTLHGKGSLQM
jgi:hypothetical protein